MNSDFKKKLNKLKEIYPKINGESIYKTDDYYDQDILIDNKDVIESNDDGNSHEQQKSQDEIEEDEIIKELLEMDKKKTQEEVKKSEDDNQSISSSSSKGKSKSFAYYDDKLDAKTYNNDIEQVNSRLSKLNNNYFTEKENQDLSNINMNEDTLNTSFNDAYSEREDSEIESKALVSNVKRQRRLIKKLSFLKIADDKVILENTYDEEDLDEDIITYIAQNSNYNAIDKVYEIQYKNYYLFSDQLKIKAKELKKRIRVETIPNFVLDISKKENRNTNLKYLRASVGSYDKPVEININYKNDYEPVTNEYRHRLSLIHKSKLEKLFEFQKQGVEFALQRRGRVLIADEMGLGKTIQSLAIVRAYKAEWPCLIICPPSLKYNWRNEISKFYDLTYDQIQIYSSSKAKLMPKKQMFVIISYNLLSKKSVIESIEKEDFKVVIADEIHAIKNKKTQRCRNILPFIMKMKRLILLSGTPILAKPIEMYPIFSALRPDMFNDINAFSRRYGICYRTSENLRELNYILECFTIRRLKKDVLSQLPDKFRQKIEIKVDDMLCDAIDKLKDKDVDGFEKIMAIYEKKDKKNNLGLIEEEEGESKSNIKSKNNNSGIYSYKNSVGRPQATDEALAKKMLNCYNKAYLLTGEAKINGVIEYMDYLIDQDIKFLIFAHHKSVLNALELKLKEYHKENNNFRYMRIDGETPHKKRNDNVIYFQSDKRCRVALLSITACNTGLTLTKASVVVFAQLYFTPAIMNQAEDRVHRIGQKSNVQAVYLLGKRTLDEGIFDTLNKKYNVVSQALDKEKKNIEYKIEQKFDKANIDEFNSKTKMKFMKKDEDIEEEEETEINQSNILISEDKSAFSTDQSSTIEGKNPFKILKDSNDNVEKKININKKLETLKKISEKNNTKINSFFNHNNKNNKNSISYGKKKREDILSSINLIDDNLPSNNSNTKNKYL